MTGPRTTPGGSLLAALKEPDEMGVWNEEGDTVWLPRSLYPKRIAAIRWAMREWGVTLPEVRCTVAWMRYEPFGAEHLDGSVAWSEDRWYECPKETQGAFKVWRLESA